MFLSLITYKNMKLIIPKEVEKRIHDYVMSVSSEIAGMGRVTVSPDGESVTVEEVMIYDQTVTGATADLSPQAIAKWQSDLVKAGGSPKHWKLWWHSHDNMEAFFSGRDTETIDGQTESDWLMSLVVNKRQEREARLDIYRPFRMFMDKVEIQIGTEIDPVPAYVVPADIAEEVALKVKRPVSSPIGFTYKPTAEKGISLHAYCPMFTTGEKKCYHPYGLSEDCTHKAFKKKHGANPFMESVEYDGGYTREQLIPLIKNLETQIDEYENRGLGDSAECLTLSTELVDMYYELAEVETDPAIAEQVRKDAQQLENVIYSLEAAPLHF